MGQLLQDLDRKALWFICRLVLIRGVMKRGGNREVSLLTQRVFGLVCVSWDCSERDDALCEADDGEDACHDPNGVDQRVDSKLHGSSPFCTCIFSRFMRRRAPQEGRAPH